MDLKLAAGLLMLSLALAGCSGDDDNGPSPQEQCAADERLWTGDACVDHTAPSIQVTGLNDTLTAYTSHAFTWVLDNGTYPSPASGPVHSMYNAIYGVTDGTVPTNATNGEEAAPGTRLALQEHADTPRTLEGSFSWDTPGDQVTLWGYMRVEGEHLWNQIQTLSVIAPPATENEFTITFAFDPASGGTTVDDSELDIGLGDGWTFINTAPYDLTITFDDECGLGSVTVAGQTTGAAGASTTFRLFAPVVCDYTANSPAAALGQNGVPAPDPGEVSGKVRASA